MKRIRRWDTLTLVLFATCLPAFSFHVLLGHQPIFDVVGAWVSLILYALVLGPLAVRIDKGHDRTKEHN